MGGMACGKIGWMDLNHWEKTLVEGHVLESLSLLLYARCGGMMEEWGGHANSSL